MTHDQPWTFILSEYLDLTFVLRSAGELVVSARSAQEALECLSHWRPRRIIVDMNCYGAREVWAYAQKRYPEVRLEVPDQTISQLLVS